MSLLSWRFAGPLANASVCGAALDIGSVPIGETLICARKPKHRGAHRSSVAGVDAHGSSVVISITFANRGRRR